MPTQSQTATTKTPNLAPVIPQSDEAFEKDPKRRLEALMHCTYPTIDNLFWPKEHEKS